MIGLNPSLDGAVQLNVPVTNPFVGADHCTPTVRGDVGATGVAAFATACTLRTLTTSKFAASSGFAADRPIRNVAGRVLEIGRAHV